MCVCAWDNCSRSAVAAVPLAVAQRLDSGQFSETEGRSKSKSMLLSGTTASAGPSDTHWPVDGWRMTCCCCHVPEAALQTRTACAPFRGRRQRRSTPARNAAASVQHILQQQSGSQSCAPTARMRAAASRRGEGRKSGGAAFKAVKGGCTTPGAASVLKRSCALSYEDVLRGQRQAEVVTEHRRW